MATKIFVSHAGADNARAVHIGEALRAGGLVPVIDDLEVKLGDSFLSFMEKALAECDYTLLLWSQAAARTPWVRAEWESAYQEAITRGRSFLVVGRLEDFTLPKLLNARVWIDLFPEIDPGVARLLEVWRADESAAETSARAVKPPTRLAPVTEHGETVYITSETFAKTFPINADLDAPAAILVERVAAILDAPRRSEHKGLFGCRYEYGLSDGKKTLVPHFSLRAQDVEAKSVLWLEISIRPFAAGPSVGDGPAAATFRGEEEEAEHAARAILLQWVGEVGLGF